MTDDLSGNRGCLGFLFPDTDDGKPTASSDAEWPYRSRRYLLSRAEMAFYRVLVDAVSDRYTVCPKVNLNDLLYLAKGTQKRMAWLSKINRKHIDFILCEPQSMQPQVAIELDDSSHDTPDAQKRDAVKDQALATAGLPLLRIPAKGSYDPDRIRQAIDDAGQRTTKSA
ncbi:MAG: DUF2726 domain-containing protein [Planctomycetota bacterium]